MTILELLAGSFHQSTVPVFSKPAHPTRSTLTTLSTGPATFADGSTGFTNVTGDRCRGLLNHYAERVLGVTGGCQPRRYLSQADRCDDLTAEIPHG